MTPEELQSHLAEIEEAIIRSVISADIGVREGKVMTDGDAPYRRLDCDGKALAYIRQRPKKRSIRIDVTGLWKAPRTTKLRVPTAGGAATLLAKTVPDVKVAVVFLLACVERTRIARQKKNVKIEPRSASEPRPDQSP